MALSVEFKMGGRSRKIEAIRKSSKFSKFSRKELNFLDPMDGRRTPWIVIQKKVLNLKSTRILQGSFVLHRLNSVELGYGMCFASLSLGLCKAFLVLA